MCGAQRRRARRFRRPRSKIRRRVQETCRPHRRTPGNRITALQRPAWIRDKRVSVHSDLSRRRRRDNGLAAIAASARGRGDRVKPGRSFILASRPQLRPLASIPPDGAAETRRRAPNGAAARHRRRPVRIPRAHRWTPKGRSRAGVRPTPLIGKVPALVGHSWFALERFVWRKVGSSCNIAQKVHPRPVSILNAWPNFLNENILPLPSEFQTQKPPAPSPRG